ncbi:MAG: hypothetical protein ABI402_16220 [Ferruginibacter sp.]
MNLNKMTPFQRNILFKRKNNIFFYIVIVLILNSCSTWVSYDSKNGSNDIIIYEDSLIRIQRSTEVIAGKLQISHLVDRKKKFETGKCSIENISDDIKDTNNKDSLSFYESCSFKKYWYSKFSDIPLRFRNLQDCASFQIIYYYPAKAIKDKIIICTNLNFILNGKNYEIKNVDTLFRNTEYHTPQP